MSSSFNILMIVSFFFLMIRRPPRSTRTDTLFPYTTLFRSDACRLGVGKFGNMAATQRARIVKRAASKNPGQPFHGGSVMIRSEEHTSELQSLMRISYAVFCLKKKKKKLTEYTNRNKH